MYDSLISPKSEKSDLNRFKASMWILSLTNYHLCLGRPGFFAQRLASPCALVQDPLRPSSNTSESKAHAQVPC